jgi:hypothetical protein
MNKIMPAIAGAILMTGLSAPLAFAAPAQGSALAAVADSPACTAAMQRVADLTQEQASDNALIAKVQGLLSAAMNDASIVRQDVGALPTPRETFGETALDLAIDTIKKATLNALDGIADLTSDLAKSAFERAAAAAGGEELAATGAAIDLLAYPVVEAIGTGAALGEITKITIVEAALKIELVQLIPLQGPFLQARDRVAKLKTEIAAANAEVASACQSSPSAASGNGQYYDNGVTYAEGVYTDGSAQYGIPVGGSVTPQYACNTVESNQGTPANGDSGDVFPQDGTDPYDIGTTEADQAEWFSGCVAGATADLNGTQSQAPTGSPAPAGSSAPTASPSTGSPAPGSPVTSSGTGSTQQYYQNGATFAKDNEGTLAANTEGAVTDAGVSACSAVASSSPGAGMAGGEDTDTGPTAADQAAWISGCAANYTGTGTSTTDPASPAATPSTTPSGDGSTQRYYTNGVGFASNGYLSMAQGASAQAKCTTAAVPGNSEAVNQVGNLPIDTGPTAADQAAWISGCVSALPLYVERVRRASATVPALANAGQPTVNLIMIKRSHRARNLLLPSGPELTRGIWRPMRRP